MRALLVASLLAFFAFPTYAQEPTDDRPIIIRQAPLDSGDVDPLVREENPLKYMKFKERLLIGGGISNLVFSSSYTVIGLAPQVGYQLTPNAIVGVEGSYTFYSQKFINQSTGSTFREKSNLIGLGIFGRHKLIFLPEQLQNLYAQVSVEQYRYLSSRGNFNYKPVALAGLGIDLGGFQITALYNVNYNELESPFPNPLVIRFGGFFTGPRF